MKSLNSMFLSAVVLAFITCGCNKTENAGGGAQGVQTNDEQSASDSGNETSVSGAVEKAHQAFDNVKSSGAVKFDEAKKWLTDVAHQAAETGGATAGDAATWANDLYNSLKEKGLTTAGSATEWLSDDIRNMGAFEYKVITLDGRDPARVEKQLNELGQQRWECFHVTGEGEQMVFYLKKDRRSYLKNVPVKDLMKLIPLMGGDGQ
jgi:hypothetical protein